jgi:uncharacterized protein with NAD-binding domain and iron-sulfur cluster
MENINDLILGGGPAGIGALSALGSEALLLEAGDRLGGLCSSFQIDGFTFDHAVHLSFTSNLAVLDYLKGIPLIKHDPESFNYCDDQWVRYPVQNNLFVLPEQEKAAIIESFQKRQSQCFSRQLCRLARCGLRRVLRKEIPVSLHPQVLVSSRQVPIDLLVREADVSSLCCRGRL